MAARATRQASACARSLRVDSGDTEEDLVRADLDADKASALIVAVSDGLQTQRLLERSIDLEETLGMLEELLRA